MVAMEEQGDPNLEKTACEKRMKSVLGVQSDFWPKIQAKAIPVR